MNIFVPSQSILNSIGCLDYRRLGKQRVEIYQLVLEFERPTNWSNHPCFKAWENNKEALIFTGLLTCFQWRMLGYKDSLINKFHEFLVYYEFEDAEIFSEGLSIFEHNLNTELVEINFHPDIKFFGLYVDNELMVTTEIHYPEWFNNRDILDSYKTSLYNKDPEHYKQFKEYKSSFTKQLWPK